MAQQRSSGERLTEHIARVEKHGFQKKNFPISYRGHVLKLTTNQAYEQDDGSFVFNFTIYCSRCMVSHNVSGRFHKNYEDPVGDMVIARLAPFLKFKETECNGKS